MEIRVHRYELRPLHPLNSRTGAEARQGALLRVETPEGTGYADLHPWEEFGDPSLGSLLEKLARGETDPLSARSLEFAVIDARARRAGVSVFAGQNIPPSHLLVTDLTSLTPERVAQAHAEGFRRLKLKAGREPGRELRALAMLARSLPEGMLLRLDFNSSLKVRAFEDFVADARARGWLERVEFFEDPVAWDRGAWGWLRREHGARLALDRESGRIPVPSEAVDVVVHKPAAQREFAEGFPLVFTSNMDHPLGLLCAAWVAAVEKARRGARVLECGLLSHQVYAPDAFSEQLRTRGAQLLAPEGTGFGFDSLLENLVWKPLP